jgi:hypothetical protein
MRNLHRYQHQHHHHHQHHHQQQHQNYQQAVLGTLSTKGSSGIKHKRVKRCALNVQFAATPRWLTLS